jgi:hypothetical protein
MLIHNSTINDSAETRQCGNDIRLNIGDLAAVRYISTPGYPSMYPDGTQRNSLRELALQTSRATGVWARRRITSSTSRYSMPKSKAGSCNRRRRWRRTLTAVASYITVRCIHRRCNVRPLIRDWILRAWMMVVFWTCFNISQINLHFLVKPNWNSHI